jgi:hypothetical protein
MPILQIEVNDNLIQDLKKFFPRNEKAAAEFASLAVQEWIAWLSGISRPTKISEQNIQRFIDIYSQIITGEMPDAGDLYNKFNIPLGQARYIIQAISYKRAGSLYALALKDVLASFDKGSVDPKLNTVTIRILKTSENILKEIIFDMAYENEKIPTPQPQKELGKFVYYALRINDIESIKNKLKEKLQNNRLQLP